MNKQRRLKKAGASKALRIALPAVLTAAVAAVLTACGGGGSDSNSTAEGGGGGESTTVSLSGDPKKCGTLNLYTWEGEAEPELMKPFEEQSGVQVKASYITSGPEAIAKLSGGGSDQYDVVTASSEILEPLKETGVLKPVDTSKIKEYDKLLKFATEPFEFDGETWGVVSDWGFNPFLYSTDVLKKEPTSWAELWNPDLKGQVSLQEDISMIWVGATVLGYDKNPEQLWDLSQDQLDAIRDKMLELKGNVRTIWVSGGDLIQLYANHEVAASMGWTYILNELQAKGEPVAEAKLDDLGAQGWSEGPSLTSGISEDCEAAAYEFANYMTSPKGQALLSETSGYTAANPTAAKHMSQETIEKTGINHPKQFLGSAIIRHAAKNPEAYNETMQEIIAGLG